MKQFTLNNPLVLGNILCVLAVAAPATGMPTYNVDIPGVQPKYTADHSGDGVVDALDYAIWRNSLGDFDQDGVVGSSSPAVVDGDDYALWRENFTDAAGGGANAFNRPPSSAPSTPGSVLNLAWRGVRLAPFFNTAADYANWTGPLTASKAGDYNGDSVVDAIDYALWREALMAQVSPAEFLGVAGDFNGDGTADGYDGGTWRINLGAPGNPTSVGAVLAGDYNNDGVVDASDYVVWRDNLGSTQAVDAASDWWWLIENLSHASALPGDTDGDGDVDDSDLGTAFASYTGPVGASGGRSVAEGDTDNDGDVDDSDLGSAFSAYTGPLAPPSVPEPASGVVLGLSALLIAGRRRG